MNIMEGKKEERKLKKRERKTEAFISSIMHVNIKDLKILRVLVVHGVYFSHGRRLSEERADEKGSEHIQRFFEIFIENIKVVDCIFLRGIGIRGPSMGIKIGRVGILLRICLGTYYTEK